MTLREGPQALDAQRLGRAAEALHIALLQSAPAEPGAEPVIRLFAAWPNDWNGSFQLLALDGFLVRARFENGAVAQVQLRSLAAAECRIANPWQARSVVLKRDGNRAETVEGELLRFPSKRDEIIELAQA